MRPPPASPAPAVAHGPAIDRDAPMVHLLTPGDHFSPRTGSAIPTVVDGLCRGGREEAPVPAVLVARGTYPDRYDSAHALEYDARSPLPAQRLLDAGLGRLGLPRAGIRRELRAALTGLRGWPTSTLLAHNAPQAVPLVPPRHRAVLYAHNVLLRSYTPREVRLALDRVAGIICVSESLASQTLPSLPPSLASRVRIVLNGVDTTVFRPRPDPARNDRLHVMFVGRMIADKGADVLLEAVRRLGRPDVVLTLVGSAGFDANARPTPFERTVLGAARELGERVRVRPFVPRPQVPGLLREADVIVVPSRWPDPCPLTVLEGMAAGAAVVASAIGGIPEQLGGAGLSVPAGDPGALADVLGALADDEPFRRRTADACRTRALSRDWVHARADLDAALGSL
ncbi:glycosyltransferase family 4 protein [Cellulomonas sp. P24]|uniref:glycosyltransferase family 4 protein n=1 Tax=Cellulomonas sp. P24 TaxID=2885206 RepID=UPI00216B19EF|nr:glycosyltransferase family 4 protein [Cellulomonas sp. P24]MCR6493773.1 glycosyltransferase family 4 protein [Cellulomonas sp. P24]